ncbi:hypothetical protein TAMA11512_09530 [Selenomonas sp. TAMA-11512]|uniref:aliphatic sulfonate ABC transporter n=1 Tax=Selenomonas sp. TAMA-11512 TaxID=3095337 RepID=UPI0030886E4A|nr:hypothetical protein TAMA11512_09530 [Selenomonas sp. TAMA-11512]
MSETMWQDLLARPWHQEVEPLLQARKIPYTVVWTRSGSNLFKVDEAAPYVLRVRKKDEGLEILLAPRMRKGGVKNGL